MNKIYLINISYGVAGTEIRLLNILKKLKERGNVNPHLVIPQTLAIQFGKTNPDIYSNKSIIIIPECKIILWLSSKKLPGLLSTLLGKTRNFLVAKKCNQIIRNLRKEKNTILHIGVPVSLLNPDKIPLVIECVDSGLDSFERLYYRKTSKYHCIVNCQTNRIRFALDNIYKNKPVNWTTVTSPSYFANYSQLDSVKKDKNPLQVIFVGRLTPIKNPELFVDAIDYVVSKGINVKAIILGEGPMYSMLAKKIELLGMKDVIKIEYTDNASSKLEESSIFTSLQVGDNYGSQSLLEAMGAGCAVVATDVGETHNIVTEDIGILIQPTIIQLGDAIIKLILNIDKTQEMGINAALKARKQYSADIYTEYLEDLYEKSLSKYNKTILTTII